MARSNLFYILLTLIGAASFFLRFIHYDISPPINEAFDEVHYAWGGATWIHEGTPRSWSNFDSYQNVDYIEKYGVKFRIVEPLVEKPPLYFLASGLTINILWKGDVFDSPHSIIRILPLLLSISTVVLVGIIGRKFYNSQTGLLASSLYAVTPTIALANRLSVAENLLTPLFLLLIVMLAPEKANLNLTKAIIAGIISFLAILTKQIGITCSIVAIAFFYLNKRFVGIILVLICSILAILTYISIGMFYNWELFLKLQQDVRIGHTLSGVPETIFSIFRFPTIGPKNHPFIDGQILLGYILLFSSPLWMKINIKNILLILFPFAYLLFLAIGQSGSTPFSFFGWYLYPLFPFLMILSAKIFYDFYKKPKLSVAIILLLTVGLSTIRFLFLALGREFYYLWQYSYILLIIATFAIFLLNKKLSNFIIITLFIIYLSINIVTDLNLPSIYENVALNDKSLSGFNY